MEEYPNQDHLSKRWMHMRRVLERAGPYAKHEYVPNPEVLPFIMHHCKVLVIGAGGLGCELLKNLAMIGFRDIHCIDMDTIDLSNLNRQFLFRLKDIGSSKAECAARFINSRVPGCRVTPHFKKIQDFDEDFYAQFYIVVCGLDSIVARRWINGMMHSLLRYEEDGSVDVSSIAPMVDGGTEGFKGSVRIVVPGMMACTECTVDLYPPQVAYPLCTIATTPRLPEHCVEYVKVMQWPQTWPFGETLPLDADDPQHLLWVFERAQERAAEFGISGLTYRLVQGVLKNIIPAVASTNAVIAAACATEVFKIATSCFATVDNNLLFNDADSIYTHIFQAERRKDCLTCSSTPRTVPIDDPNSFTLQMLVTFLCESNEFQMRQPGLATIGANGKNRTLYMSSVASLEEATRPNLKKSLGELGLKDGQELTVADPSSPNAILIRLRYRANEVEML